MRLFHHRSLLLFVTLTSALRGQDPAPPPRQVDPLAGVVSLPGETFDDSLDEAQARALAQVAADLEARKVTAQAVLLDPAWMPLHGKSAFRELMRAHAPTGELRLANADEPGTPLQVTATLVGPYGKPVANALMYAYHTSARGWYGADRAHIPGNSGDVKHARLFGYVRSDANGQIVLHTIRPVSYPRSTLPAHIHISVDIDKDHSYGTEFLFEGDPLLTTEQRKRSLDEGALIAPVTEVPGHGQSVSYRLELQSEH